MNKYINFHDQNLKTFFIFNKKLKNAILVHLAPIFFSRTIRSKNNRLVPDIIEGKIEGRRGRGRPRICYMDNVRQWTEMKMGPVIQACHDRQGWRELVRKAARAANAHPDDAA